MKILITLLMILIMLPAGAKTLTGGVAYTPESARKQAFEGAKYSIPVESFKKHLVDVNYAENMKYKRLGSVDLGDRLISYFSDGGYIITYLEQKLYAYSYSKKMS